MSNLVYFGLAHFGVTTLRQLDDNQLRLIRTSISLALDTILKEVIYEATTNWRKFVKEQLHKGGGLLFKIISKEEKAFLNVDISKFGKDTCSPSPAIAEQTKFWNQYWAPLKDDLIQQVAKAMEDLRDRGFEYIRMN